MGQDRVVLHRPIHATRFSLDVNTAAKPCLDEDHAMSSSRRLLVIVAVISNDGHRLVGFCWLDLAVLLGASSLLCGAVSGFIGLVVFLGLGFILFLVLGLRLLLFLLFLILLLGDASLLLRR